MRVIIDGPLSRVESNEIKAWAHQLRMLSKTIVAFEFRQHDVGTEVAAAGVSNPLLAGKAAFDLQELSVKGLNVLAVSLYRLAHKTELAAQIYEDAEARNSMAYELLRVGSSPFYLVPGLLESAGGYSVSPGSCLTAAGMDSLIFTMNVLRRDYFANKEDSTREYSRDLAMMLDIMQPDKDVLTTYLDEDGRMHSFRTTTERNIPEWAASKLWDFSKNPLGETIIFAGITFLASKMVDFGIKQKSRPVVEMRKTQELNSNQFAKPSTQAQRISELASSGRSGQFEIQQHTFLDRDGKEKHSYSVVLRGTQEWVTGTGNIQDMENNLRLVGGLPSEQQQAVIKAMDAIGIQPDDPVEFVGHSQAGADVAAISRDPLFNQRFNIVSSLTLGGPTGEEAPVSGVQMMQVEVSSDGVPTLDGAAAPKADNVVRVLADTCGNTHHSHAIENYQQVMKYVETSENSDAQAWLKHRNHELGLDRKGTTKVYTFNTDRV